MVCVQAPTSPGERKLDESNSSATVIPPLLLTGDFNTQPGDRPVLEGKLTAPAPSQPEADGSCDGGNTASSLEIATGFVDGALQWEGSSGERLTLLDAFADVHQRGAGVGEGRHCTSRNADRIEWIDYIWYSEHRLEPLRRTQMRTPPQRMPSVDHPSDHHPIGVRFRVLPAAA